MSTFLHVLANLKSIPLNELERRCPGISRDMIQTVMKQNIGFFEMLRAWRGESLAGNRGNTPLIAVIIKVMAMAMRYNLKRPNGYVG